MGSRRQHVFVLLFVRRAGGRSPGSSSPPRKRSSASICRAGSSWSTKVSRPAPRPKSPVKTSKTRSTSSKSGSTTSACPSPKSPDSAPRRSRSACPASPTPTAPPNRWGRPRSSTSTTGSRTCSAPSARSAATPARRPPAAAVKKLEKEWKEAGRNPKSTENQGLILSGAYPNAYTAALLAAEQEPIESRMRKMLGREDRATTSSKKTRRTNCSPARRRSKKDLYESPTGETLPKDGLVVEVPAGTVLVSELPTDDERQGRRNRRSPAGSR